MKHILTSALLISIIVLILLVALIFIVAALFADSIFCLVKGKDEEVIYWTIFIWLAVTIFCLLAHPTLIIVWMAATLAGMAFVHYTDKLTNKPVFMREEY